MSSSVSGASHSKLATATAWERRPPLLLLLELDEEEEDEEEANTPGNKSSWKSAPISLRLPAAATRMSAASSTMGLPAVPVPVAVSPTGLNADSCSVLGFAWGLLGAAAAAGAGLTGAVVTTEGAAAAGWGVGFVGVAGVGPVVPEAAEAGGAPVAEAEALDAPEGPLLLAEATEMMAASWAAC